MRFVLIFIFVALPCLDTYGITKVYNIIDRKLKIHTYEPLTVDQKKKIGKKIENGKSMFIYQALKAFEIWHGIRPEINAEVSDLIK